MAHIYECSSRAVVINVFCCISSVSLRLRGRLIFNFCDNSGMPKYRSSLAACLVLHLLFAQIQALAWGNEGHRYINQVAAKKIPHDMPGFFRSAVDRLTYLAPEPDRWREKVEPTLKNVQEPDHFFNME